MKKYYVFLFGLFVFLILFVGIAAQRNPIEYESEWVSIAPGQSYSFAHPLGKQPRILYVWTRLPGGQMEDIETIRPWTEFGDLISVLDVSMSDVIILNSDTQVWQIKIFVR